MHQYKTEQWLPISLQEAWNFFSSPKNLTLITPPELGFKILTQLNGEEIYEGMKIDYKVKPLLGIPVHWRTEICRVQKEKLFTDRQEIGPYKVWEHTHYFIEQNGGTLMKDEVNYLLPFGAIGRMTHSILVKKKIENIFHFRRNILKKLFIKNATD